MVGCLAAVRAKCTTDLFYYGHFNSGEWITIFGSSSNRSCMQRPRFYLLFQLLEAVAITAIWLWSFGHTVTDGCGDKFFIFLTYISLTLQATYTWLACYSSFKANAMTKGTCCKNSSTPWFAKAAWMLQDLLLPMTFFVFVLYFALVMDWSKPPAFPYREYFEHGLNFIIMMLDVFLSRKPVYLLHGLHFFFFAMTYVVFTIIYHAANGTNCRGKPYVYAAVDWNNPQKTITLMAMLLFVAVPAVNILLWLLVTRCFPNRFQDDVAGKPESKAPNTELEDVVACNA